MASTIVNSIKLNLPGFGAPGLGNKQGATNVFSASPATLTAALPTTPAAQTVNYGYVRVKVSALNGSAVMGATTVTATDGTTTIYIAAWPIPIASPVAGQGVEFVAPFCSDLNLNSFSCSVVVTTNTNGTLDFEVAGNL